MACLGFGAKVPSYIVRRASTLCDMPPKTIRFPDELAARVEERARCSDRSFSWVVLRAVEVALAAPGGPLYERALEKALGDVGPPRVDRDASNVSSSPVSSRAPSFSAAEAARERQARLNKAKGL